MGTPRERTSREEELRLATLASYQILDTPPEPAFDSLAHLAAELCDTPIALVSLVDRERQWFKARVGLEARETPRSIAFCDHAIRGHETFEVSDARRDERFADNPLVTGALGLRFYAGRPLRPHADGLALGTLCVLDTKPRALSRAQRRTLDALACQVECALQLRRLVCDAEERERQLERALRVQDELAKYLVHDLKSPMLAVGMNAEALRSGELPEEEIRAISADLRHASQTMQRMTSNLLDLARADARGLTATAAPVDLADLLRSLVASVNRAVPEARIELRLEVERPVRCDGELVRRLVDNLLSNALRYARDTPIVLSCATAEGTCRVEVRDGGPGIEPALREAVFARFAQVEDASHRGYGLGLAFCRLVADAHAGTLRIEDNAPRGARLIFEFPCG